MTSMVDIILHIISKLCVGEEGYGIFSEGYGIFSVGKVLGYSTCTRVLYSSTFYEYS